MRVLITGGAGFIGTPLASLLDHLGDEVTILDNRSEQMRPNGPTGPTQEATAIRFVLGDLRNESILNEVLQNQDAIIHLGASTGTAQSMYEIAQYEDVNVGGTAKLLNQLARQRFNHQIKLILASSRAVYGEGSYFCDNHGIVFPKSLSVAEKLSGIFDPLCPVCHSSTLPVAIAEDSPCNPASWYGLTKLMQEQMFRLFAETHDVSVTILRFQNVYGPGQCPDNPYSGIISCFAKFAQNNRDICIFEDGLQSRDCVYIKDAIASVVNALELAHSGAETFNIGSGEATTLLQIAKEISAWFGTNTHLNISGMFREGDIRHSRCDLRAARLRLNYSPQWSLHEGLADYLPSFNSTTSSYDTSLDKSLDELEYHGLLHGRRRQIEP